ncbi:guanosine monophosphate reductase [Candidatus Woesearchaeota archaeon]|nr:guanosine monophosphate reductase [Candidatus Woesearchaeota archaeon]
MIRDGLSFDDVLLVPRYSTVKSRSKVSIEPSYRRDSMLTNPYKAPFIAAPMDTISSVAMADAMYTMGGFCVTHRFNSVKEQIAILQKIKHREARWAAIGLKDGVERITSILNEVDIHGVCLDVAHGHHEDVIRFTSELKKLLSSKRHHLMVGNVATKKGFADLQSAGADSIRVGIGSGSICSTRLMTGFGVPQLSAVMDCAKVKHSALLIADGGIKKPADVVKALAAGADFVMAGGIFAGTEECPIKGVYRGMASKDAMSQLGRKVAPEGVTFEVPERGSVKDVLFDYIGGLKSALSYAGANNISEFQRYSKFIRTTNSGILESQTTNFNII